MNTKVKGEAIKENSIPLSALSDEVKDKIENAGGGADWNAQPGEAGYIENKPFYEHIQSYRLDDVDKINRFDYIEEGAPAFGLIYDGGITVFKDETYFGQDVDSFGAWGTLLNSRAKELGCVVIEQEDGKYELVVPMYYDEGLPGWRVVYSESCGVEPLPSRFIPDTIIKTTPQRLSDTHKNQALANLGIDPVVWKYMCNPVIIKQGKKVPEELIGEYSNDVGYSGGYYLKYPNLAMYKIMITSDRIDSEFGGDCSVIITPSSINEYGLGIQNIYISKDYGVYAGGANIDKDKKWEIQ